MPKNPPEPSRQPTGRLILEGLEGFAYHGNNPAETKLGQTFVVDLEVVTDTRQAAATDRIEDTVNYPTLEKIARRILEGPPR
ncbi:MAG: dihydroneopterin aldolase, partial [Candidatus Dormibacteraeota bacterium]|nr:dihydroneopterin aldolase [Candidatus Dormibacteraeota bacterium]